MTSTWQKQTAGILLVATLIVAVCNGQTSRAQQPESSDPDPALVSNLIEQLGSAVFDEREAALKSLRKLGSAARTQLFDARNHKSPEVRSRVVQLMRQLDVAPLAEAIQAFASQPDDKLDLEEGMWLMSRILNPECQRVPLARQLDALADAVRKKLGPHRIPKLTDPEQVVAALRATLFDDLEFCGNFEDYENPANSSLEKVLETKKGLPILLSHVVVAVGRRLEIPIVGVPTPRRYIVKYDGERAPEGFPHQDIYFDPFNSGRLLDREGRLKTFPDVNPDQMVPPQSARYDLIRMLANFETELFNRDESNRAYLAVAFRVALHQNASD